MGLFFTESFVRSTKNRTKCTNLKVTKKHTFELGSFVRGIITYNNLKILILIAVHQTLQRQHVSCFSTYSSNCSSLPSFESLMDDASIDDLIASVIVSVSTSSIVSVTSSTATTVNCELCGKTGLKQSGKRRYQNSDLCRNGRDQYTANQQVVNEQETIEFLINLCQKLMNITV